MSVIVAIRQGGTIYMGADTQSTAVNIRAHGLHKDNLKIKKLANGVFSCACGRVVTLQTVYAILNNLPVLDEQGLLTKAHLVREVVPALCECMREAGFVNGRGEMDAEFILTYQDKGYVIFSNFSVYAIGETFSLGAGSCAAEYALKERVDLPVRERILLALRCSAATCDTVGAPFALVDTAKQEFEIVEA